MTTMQGQGRIWRRRKRQRKSEGGRGGRGKKTKGHFTVRGDDDYNNYAPAQPDYGSAAMSSDSEPEIPFTFGPRCAGSPPISRG